METLAAFLANPIALEFCMGLCLALTYSRLTRLSITAAPALCLLGLGLIIVATLFVAHPSTNGLIGFPRVLAWGLPATMVVWGSLWIDATGTRIARFGVLIGDASYALYLTHGFVMIGYAWLLKYTSLGSTTQILVVPIVVMVAVLVGLCAHVAVERPLLRLARVTRAFRPVGVRPVAY
jgi:exopolysaccharide production protein ExoZ